MKYSKQYLFYFLFAIVFSSVLDAQSVGGTTSGGATYCGTANSGFISVTGYVGNITGWQSSTNGGASWTNIANVTPSQSYNALTQTTCFRAVVTQPGFPADTSSISCVIVVPPTVGGTVSGGGTFCNGSGAGMLTLSGNVGSVLNWQSSTDGGLTWTLIADTNTTLNYANVTQNTIYEAVVQNTTFCSIDTSLQASFTIVPPTVAGSISAADTVCFSSNGDTLILTGYTGSVIEWLVSVDTGQTWTSLANTTDTNIYSGLTQTSLFAAVVQNGTCSADTASAVMISVLPPVVVNAGSNVTIAPWLSASLSGTGNGSPVWTPGAGLSNPFSFNPTATPSVTTTYVLTVTDTNGCVGSDAVTVTVTIPTYQGMITTLFTPNEDGINDAWYIENAIYYPDNEVAVYNIYGNEVFRTTGYKNDWKGTYNGTPLPDGTYIYVVKMDSTSEVFQGTLEILTRK